METQGASGVVWSELDALRGSRLKHTKSTVFIISDVRLYREGLAWNLTHEGSLQVLGASGPSPSTFDLLDQQVPDAIIFDITMRDGLQLARELHARWPNAKIVAFAVSDVDCEIISG